MNTIQRTVLMTLFAHLILGVAFAGECPSVEMVKATEMTHMMKDSDMYYMYGDIEFQGKIWHVATGLFRDEEEAHEMSAMVLQKADTPEVDERRSETFCTYYLNFSALKIVAATDGKLPEQSLLFSH